MRYLTVRFLSMRALMLLSLGFLLCSFSLFADTIKPFTSDGCSAFPDGTFAHQELWLTCCTAHDFEYWQGGTFEQRLKSDKKLKQCVADVGEPHIANLMMAGVRVGGSPFFPTPFRWGYGWQYPRFYQVLTDAEKQQIVKVIQETDYGKALDNKQ